MGAIGEQQPTPAHDLGPRVGADGRLGCRLCAMSFTLYANYLQHKRKVHCPAASSSVDTPARVDVARPPFAAPSAGVPSSSDAATTVGTPATVVAPASGALGATHGQCRGDGGLRFIGEDVLTPPPISSPMPSSLPIPASSSAAAVAHRIATFYRSKGDMGRTTLYVPTKLGARKSDFVTPELKSMRLFALSAGGCGLSKKAKKEYYDTTLAVERAAMRMVAEADARRKKRKKGKNGKGKMPKLAIKLGPLESAFPTAASFVRSLEGEQGRCLSELEWRETDIIVRDKVYKFYSRDMMRVATDALTSAIKVCLRGERRHDEAGNVIRTNTLDSDVYLEEQADVCRLHAGKKHRGRDMPPFTLAIQVFSDAALVSWNGSM